MTKDEANTQMWRIQWATTKSLLFPTQSWQDKDGEWVVQVPAGWGFPPAVLRSPAEVSTWINNLR